MSVCIYCMCEMPPPSFPLPIYPPPPSPTTAKAERGGGDRGRKKGNRNKEGGGDGNNGQSEEEVKSAFSSFPDGAVVRGVAPYAAFATTAAVAMMLQPQRRRRRRKGAKAMTTTTTTTTFSSAPPEKGEERVLYCMRKHIWEGAREGEYLIKIVSLLALRRNGKKVHFLCQGPVSILTSPSKSSFTSSSLARMAPESKRRRSIERMEL